MLKVVIAVFVIGLLLFCIIVYMWHEALKSDVKFNFIGGDENGKSDNQSNNQLVFNSVGVDEDTDEGLSFDYDTIQLEYVSVGSICSLSQEQTNNANVLNKPGVSLLLCNKSLNQICVGNIYENDYGKCLSQLNGICTTINDCTQEADLCLYGRCVKQGDLLYKPCLRNSECYVDTPNFQVNKYLKCDLSINQCKYDIGPLNIGCENDLDCAVNDAKSLIYCNKDYVNTYESYRAEVYKVGTDTMNYKLLPYVDGFISGVCTTENRLTVDFYNELNLSTNYNIIVKNKNDGISMSKFHVKSLSNVRTVISDNIYNYKFYNSADKEVTVSSYLSDIKKFNAYLNTLNNIKNNNMVSNYNLNFLDLNRNKLQVSWTYIDNTYTKTYDQINELNNIIGLRFNILNMGWLYNYNYQTIFRTFLSLLQDNYQPLEESELDPFANNTSDIKTINFDEDLFSMLFRQNEIKDLPTKIAIKNSEGNYISNSSFNFSKSEIDATTTIKVIRLSNQHVLLENNLGKYATITEDSNTTINVTWKNKADPFYSSNQEFKFMTGIKDNKYDYNVYLITANKFGTPAKHFILNNNNSTFEPFDYDISTRYVSIQNNNPTGGLRYLTYNSPINDSYKVNQKVSVVSGTVNGENIPHVTDVIDIITTDNNLITLRGNFGVYNAEVIDLKIITETDKHILDMNTLNQSTYALNVLVNFQELLSFDTTIKNINELEKVKNIDDLDEVGKTNYYFMNINSNQKLYNDIDPHLKLNDNMQYFLDQREGNEIFDNGRLYKLQSMLNETIDSVDINLTNNPLTNDVKIELISTMFFIRRISGEQIINSGIILIKLEPNRFDIVSTEITYDNLIDLSESNHLFFNIGNREMVKEYQIVLESNIKVSELKNNTYAKFYNEFKEGVYNYLFTKKYLPVLINENPMYAQFNFLFDQQYDKTYLNYTSTDNKFTDYISRDVENATILSCKGIYKNILPSTNDDTNISLIIKGSNVIPTSVYMNSNDDEFENWKETNLSLNTDLLDGNNNPYFEQVKSKEYNNFYAYFTQDKKNDVYNLFSSILTELYHTFKNLNATQITISKFTETNIEYTLNITRTAEGIYYKGEELGNENPVKVSINIENDDNVYKLDLNKIFDPFSQSTFAYNTYRKAPTQASLFNDMPYEYMIKNLINKFMEDIIFKNIVINYDIGFGITNLYFTENSIVQNTFSNPSHLTINNKTNSTGYIIMQDLSNENYIKAQYKLNNNEIVILNPGDGYIKEKSVLFTDGFIDTNTYYLMHGEKQIESSVSLSMKEELSFKKIYSDFGSETYDINIKFGYKDRENSKPNMCMARLSDGSNITTTNFANNDLECNSLNPKVLADSTNRICQIGKVDAGAGAICLKDLNNLNQESCYMRNNMLTVPIPKDYINLGLKLIPGTSLLDPTNENNIKYVANNYDKAINNKGEGISIQCLDYLPLKQSLDTINRVDKNKLGICSFPVLEQNEICLEPEVNNCSNTLTCANDTFTNINNVPFCQPIMDVVQPGIGYECSPQLKKDIILDICKGSSFCTNDNDCFSLSCNKNEGVSVYRLDLKKGKSFESVTNSTISIPDTNLSFGLSGSTFINKLTCELDNNTLSDGVCLFYFESLYGGSFNYTRIYDNTYATSYNTTTDYQIRDFVIGPGSSTYALTLKIDDNDSANNNYYAYINLVYIEKDKYNNDTWLNGMNTKISQSNVSLKLSSNENFYINPQLTLNDNYFVIQWDDTFTGQSTNFNNIVFFNNLAVKFNDQGLFDFGTSANYNYTKKIKTQSNFSNSSKDIYYFPFETYDENIDNKLKLVENNYDIVIKSNKSDVDIISPEPILSSKINLNLDGKKIESTNKIEDYILDTRVKASGSFYRIDVGPSSGDFDISYDNFITFSYTDQEGNEKFVTTVDNNYYIENTQVLVFCNKNDIDLILRNGFSEIAIGGCIEHKKGYYTNIQHGAARVFTIQKILDHIISDIEPYNEVLIVQSHNIIFTKGENITPFDDTDNFTNFRDARSTVKWNWDLHPDLFYFYTGNVYKLYNASKYMHHDREINGVSFGGGNYWNYTDDKQIKEDYGDLLDMSGSEEGINRYNFFCGKAGIAAYINDRRDSDFTIGDGNMVNKIHFKNKIKNTIINTGDENDIILSDSDYSNTSGPVVSNYNPEFIGGGVKPLDMAQIIDISTMLEVSNSGYKTVYSSNNGTSLEYEENPFKDVGKYDDEYRGFIDRIKRNYWTRKWLKWSSSGSAASKSIGPKNSPYGVPILSNNNKFFGDIKSPNIRELKCFPDRGKYDTGPKENIFIGLYGNNTFSTPTNLSGTNPWDGVSTKISNSASLKLHATNFYSTTMMNFMPSNRLSRHPRVESENSTIQSAHAYQTQTDTNIQIYNTYIYDYGGDSRYKGDEKIGYNNNQYHSIITNNDAITQKEKYLGSWRNQKNKTISASDSYMKNGIIGLRERETLFGAVRFKSKRKVYDRLQEVRGYNINKASSIISNGVHNQVYTGVVRKNNMFLFNLFLDENYEDDSSSYPFGVCLSETTFLDDNYNNYLKYLYNSSNEDVKNFINNNFTDGDRIKDSHVTYNTDQFIFKHDFYCFNHSLFMSAGSITSESTLSLNNRYISNYIIDNDITMSEITTYSSNINWPSWITQIRNIMYQKNNVIKKICYIPTTKNMLNHLNYFAIVNSYDLSSTSRKFLNIEYNKLDLDKIVIQSKDELELIKVTVNLSSNNWNVGDTEITLDNNIKLNLVLYRAKPRYKVVSASIINSPDVTYPLILDIKKEYISGDKTVTFNFTNQNYIIDKNNLISSNKLTIQIDNNIDTINEIEVDDLIYNTESNSKFIIKNIYRSSDYIVCDLDRYMTKINFDNIYDRNNEIVYIYKPTTLGYIFTTKNSSNFVENRPIVIPSYKKGRITNNGNYVYMLSNKCT